MVRGGMGCGLLKVGKCQERAQKRNDRPLSSEDANSHALDLGGVFITWTSLHCWADIKTLPGGWPEEKQATLAITGRVAAGFSPADLDLNEELLFFLGEHLSQIIGPSG
jgi:hypothetical protein